MSDNQNLINIAPTWTSEECRESPVGASRLIQEMAYALEAAKHQDAEDIIVQEVSRLAGMRLLRKYSNFGDEWWEQLYAGIARVALSAKEA